MKKRNKKGFTLIELLVVVLIIGILASVALPQYQKAVEKSRMTEAIMLVRKIVDAQQVFYMANGRYATFAEMDALDITIPHTSTVSFSGQNRWVTKDFAYTCQGSGDTEIAVAQRMPAGNRYYIRVLSSNLEKFDCQAYDGASTTQRNLCQQLNTKGNL